GAPFRGAFGAQSFEDILDVLADRYFLVRLRNGRHLEDIGKHVILRVVINHLDAALEKIVERAEPRAVLGLSGCHQLPPLPGIPSLATPWYRRKHGHRKPSGPRGNIRRRGPRTVRSAPQA